MNTSREIKKLALLAPSTQADVAAMAERLGWQFEDHFSADRQHGAETIWSVPGADTEIHCIDNRMVSQLYLAVVRPRTSDIETTLRGSLRLADLSVALAMVRDARDSTERLAAARLLAVLAPDAYVEKVMHALADLLHAGDAEERMAYLDTIAAIGWVELWPLVNALAVSDPENAVRSRANDLVEVFHRLHDRSLDPADDTGNISRVARMEQ